MAVAVLLGCSDDDGGDAGTPSAVERSSSTSTTASTLDERPPGEPVDDHLLTVDDLPDGFDPVTEVDDTITAFCAGEDATAGLAASARAVAAFTRSPEGASVIQLVFRFEDDGAERFVAQADAILERCQAVPDLSGLAFEYEPVSDEVAAALAGADPVTSRHGTSVGSGNLTVDIAVFARGDVGALVAVLGVQVPRAELDAVAARAFRAAVERAAGA